MDMYIDIAIKLGCALATGIILGLNRWLHHKSAGIRTHSLVSVGSASAILLMSTFSHNDPQAVSHVLQGLVTGLGFLGAGVILHQDRSSKVHGLTTAASLWAVAIIGAAFGGGEFALGLLSLGAIYITLALGGPLERLASNLTGIKRSSEISGDED